MEETFQHSQFFNASSSLQTNTNGMPRMGNSYQIEGVDNNERTGLLQVLISPSEAISTVSVSTTNHDIELGRGTGAITATKSEQYQTSFSMERTQLAAPAVLFIFCLAILPESEVAGHSNICLIRYNLPFAYKTAPSLVEYSIKTNIWTCCFARRATCYCN